jgi:hypothetical protein
MALRDSTRFSDDSSSTASVSSSNTPAQETAKPLTGCDILRETFEVSEDISLGEISFSLSTVSMKGVSKKTGVAIDDLPGFISMLEKFYYEGTGDNSGDSSEGKNAVQIFQDTIRKNDEGRVYFRTLAGKGQKPTSLREGDLPILLNFIKSKRAALVRAYNQKTGESMV